MKLLNTLLFFLVILSGTQSIICAEDNLTEADIKKFEAWERKKRDDIQRAHHEYYRGVYSAGYCSTVLSLMAGTLTGMVTGVTALKILEKIEMNPEFRETLSIRTGFGAGLITAILLQKYMKQ